jgi:hypothetical protein
MDVTSRAFSDRQSGFYRGPFVLARQLFDIFCHAKNLDRSHIRFTPVLSAKNLLQTATQERG